MTKSLMSKLKGTFEERVIGNLESRGVQYQYEPHTVPYTVERKYIPDLYISGKYVECKGYFRQDAQRKMKAVKSQHPDLDIRFLFQRGDSPIQGAKKRKDGSKMTCGEWADRNGFVWAEGETIPEDWI
jgi:hypothetical protein